MLNLDGIAASMASIESALYAIITHETAASMASTDLALYAMFTNDTAAKMASTELAQYAMTTNGCIGCTIMGLAKTFRLQEHAVDRAPSSTSIANTLHITLMLTSVQQHHNAFLMMHTATVISNSESQCFRTS